MTYEGRFADSLVADQLDKLSVSFLVTGLDVRRGGVAPNICFGLARLGASPVLVGAAGKDFAEYRSWLERHGVDCNHVHLSDTAHTARFVCTTDNSMSQIASFYPGAMDEADLIEIGAIVGSGEPEAVLIGADNPVAMKRHTEECRERGWRFYADPSQQLSFADGELIRSLVDGAAILFSNEYESHIISDKTGWSAEEILDRVDLQVTTLGGEGVLIQAKGSDPIKVPALPGVKAIEPTGAGDSFRAGFLAALGWGFDHAAAAQVGCTIAAFVVESIGTQEYSFTNEEFLARLGAAYGDAAAAAVAAKLA